ncbi:MAG: hypothetical protein ACREA0_16890, partial [bacterium]
MGARATSKSCKPVRWLTSPAQTATAANDVVFNVVTSTTELEVYSAAAPVWGELNLEGTWGHTSFIDPSGSGGYLRTFRWQTDQEGVSEGRWEVSYSPLGGKCKAAGEVLESDVVPHGKTFEIDFLELRSKIEQEAQAKKKAEEKKLLGVGDASAGKGVAPALKPGNAVQPESDADKAPPGVGASSGEGSKPSASGKKAPLGDGGSSGKYRSVDKNTFFVRIVPLSGSCTSASNTVTVRITEPAPPTPPPSFTSGHLVA